jgi:hypothetical protein
VIYEIELTQIEGSLLDDVQTRALFFVEFANDAEALGFIYALDGRYTFDYQLAFRPARPKGKNGRLFLTHEHDELKRLIEAYLKDDTTTIAELENDDEWDEEAGVFASDI